MLTITKAIAKVVTRAVSTVADTIFVSAFTYSLPKKPIKITFLVLYVE